ncbi:MAG: DUF3137 domain-containing protein [Aureispira sp.]
MFKLVQLESSLKAHLEELEQERLVVAGKISARTKGVILVGLIGFVLLASVAFKQWQEGGPEALVIAIMIIGSIFLLLIGGIVYALLTKGLRKRYNKKIKAKIYEKALQCYNKTVVYHPEKYIRESTFKNAGLFSGFNRYGGEDLCTGSTVDNRSFQFSELKVYHKQHSSNKNGNSNKVRTIFEGLFYEMRLPITFPARVKILPDQAEKNFGAVGKFMQGMLNKAMSTASMSDPLVRFDEEHPDFERSFKIFSNSEAAARQLINADFIQKIQALQHSFKTDLHFFFEEEYCYFAVKRGRFLEVDVNRSLLGTVFIDQLEENLDWCFGLLKHLEELTAGRGAAPSSNPFDENRTIKETKTPLPPPRPSNENLPNTYKKSNSKDNPFLL